MSGPVRISIILPTLQGERDLRRLLPALAGQSLARQTQIIAVDSSSTDASVELLRSAGASVEVIARSEFGHGRTRNQAASRAQGEFLVFLSQDALPKGPEFLAELLAPFRDPLVWAVCARILPHDDDDPLTARTVLTAPHARAAAPAEKPPPFNNVASAMRASAWRAVPLPEVSFGEDGAWQERAQAQGGRIAFAPVAIALHAHCYGPRLAYARYRTDAQFQREQLGLRLRPTVWSALRGMAFEVREDWRFLARRSAFERLRFGLWSPVLRAGQILGQYAGSRGPLKPDLRSKSDGAGRGPLEPQAKESGG